MAAFDSQALALLCRGLEHFRARDYFAAHDDWEEVLTVATRVLAGR